MNPKMIPHGIALSTVPDQANYLQAIAERESEGYTFVPCDDLKRLHWGALGSKSSSHPLVWIRTPILHVVGPAPEGSRIGDSTDMHRFIAESDTHLGSRIEEVDTDVFRYHKAFLDHKKRGHHVVETGDSLAFRLAFVCITCGRIVRVEHDQCIDLAIALESSVREEEHGSVG